MMRALRQIYDSLPPVIEIPSDLRRRHVEIVFLELEDSDVSGSAASADWPAGLYERTAGAWQGELFRESQGEYEQRLAKAEQAPTRNLSAGRCFALKSAAAPRLPSRASPCGPAHQGS